MDKRFLIDFGVFMQAITDLGAGLNPYAREGFFSPPWLFYFLLPFSILPPRIGEALWFALNLGSLIACIGSVSIQHRFRSLWIVALAASPIAWPYLFFGNIIGLVGIGLVGLFNWRRSWLAIPLILLKPQLSLVALIVWAFRNGRNQIIKGAGFLAILNVPLIVWKPSLYRQFFQKSISGQYLLTQSGHITAATSRLPLGSFVWMISSGMLIVVLLLLTLWVRNERVTLLSTILANPFSGGGEYALLTLAAAMGNLDRKDIPVIAVTIFGLPLMSLFVPGGDMLAPLAAAILLAWAIYSRKGGEKVAINRELLKAFFVFGFGIIYVIWLILVRRKRS